MGIKVGQELNIVEDEKAVDAQKELRPTIVYTTNEVEKLMGIKVGQELNIIEGQPVPVAQELRPIIVYAKKEIEKPVYSTPVRKEVVEETVVEETVVIRTHESEDSLEFFNTNSRYMNDLLTTKE